MRNLLVLTSLSLAAATAIPAAPASTMPAAEAWTIGPIIRSRNYSVGMPISPAPAGRGWSFDFPYPHRGAGHVHYVTFNPGSLLGGSRIAVRYRVEAARGTRFVPQEHQDMAGTVSLYFQRRGDNWSGRRQFEFFRWYAPPQTVHEIAPGVHEMIVDFADGGWVSVEGSPSANHRQAFRAALADVEQVGLVFGSSSARGHGVFSTGPARFTLLSFRLL